GIRVHTRAVDVDGASGRTVFRRGVLEGSGSRGCQNDAVGSVQSRAVRDRPPQVMTARWRPGLHRSAGHRIPSVAVAVGDGHGVGRADAGSYDEQTSFGNAIRECVGMRATGRIAVVGSDSLA